MWRALFALSLLVVTIEASPNEGDFTVEYYLSNCVAEPDKVVLSVDEQLDKFGKKSTCHGYVAGVLDGVRVGAEIIRIRGQLEMDLLKDIVGLCLPNAPMSTETILSVINTELAVSTSEVTTSDTLRAVIFAALVRQFRC